jgi:hypothetical protein
MSGGRPWRVLLVYAASRLNATYSYQHAWPRHLRSHPSFEPTPLNLAELGVAGRLAAVRAVRKWRGDAVVLLHSVFSNAPFLEGRLLAAVASRREPKVFFIGNEYKSMPEKMAFAETLGVSLLVSQSTSPAVHRLYRERLGCAVAGIPNTGLDPSLFRPVREVEQRPIDLGYRAAAAPAYLGHTERQDLADYFRANAARLGVNVDVSLNAGDRFDEPAWAEFLNTCKGQLGTEAGGDYFELTDRTRREVIEFERNRPDTSFADIFERFFTRYGERVPMRILSGRNVEAAGTRTVQMLFEGSYDGYFHPDEHYIPLKKDFSNVDEAIRKFRDRGWSAAIADNAYRFATTELTYDRLIGRLEHALAEIATPSVVS